MKANSLEELVTNSNIAGELRNYTDWHTRLVKFAQLVVDWQKEQDQPITGNSLEQEWLRYVDKKKKEYGGELPSLGEYGWLQIARHFADWQKNQMLKDASVADYVAVDDGRIELEGDPLPCLNPIILLPYPQFQPGDRVKVIVLKAEEE